VLHRVLKGATYEETLEALEDRFGDQHFVDAYHSQLKTRTQGVGELLQEFSTAVERLAHHAYSALCKDHIRRETGKVFADGLGDPAINVQLLLGGEKTVNKTQASPQAAGCASSSQAQKNEHQDILGEPICPNQLKRPKTIGLLELWGARPLLG
jgi:hypothetical protein